MYNLKIDYTMSSSWHKNMIIAPKNQQTKPLCHYLYLCHSLRTTDSMAFLWNKSTSYIFTEDALRQLTFYSNQTKLGRIRDLTKLGTSSLTCP